MSDSWLSPKEAGALLGVGPDRVSQLAREGTLKAVYTPGGQIRIRRDQLEELLAEPTSEAETSSAPPPGAPSPPTPSAHSEPPPPEWMRLPPWKQRVHEAEAELDVLKLDGERERVLESREARESARHQAAAERAARVAETARLRGLRDSAMREVPYLTPPEVRAEVARELESCVTTEHYPATLADEHIATLLKAEVGRLLRPWRAREARRERSKRDIAERERIIGSAVMHLFWKMPLDWDADTRADFRREVRIALEDDVTPGMDQAEANAIARDVLDEWLEEQE